MTADPLDPPPMPEWMRKPKCEGITRAGVLHAAEKIVTRDRQATHGKPEDSFAQIAQLWSAYLGVPVQPHDVAALMALLKLARIRENPKHADNWIDLAGYAACGAEVAS